MVSGEIDLAVHSAKDVPIDIDARTQLVPVLARANCRDVLLLKNATSLTGGKEYLSELPAGSSIGTASLRRKAQLLKLNPGLSIVPLRGNVPTRIKRLEESDSLSGVVLAAAGLERLKLDTPYSISLTVDEMLPAVGQGILVVQLLKDRGALLDVVRQLEDGDCSAVWAAERACVNCLGADCGSSVGVYAHLITNGQLHIEGRVCSPDGRHVISEVVTGVAEDAIQLGVDLAQKLLERGAEEYL